MTISHNINTVWCLIRNSHSITSWDCHTIELERKHTIDLSKHLKWICCELNYDPSSMALVSIECVSDTLWVGLSCGVIVMLSDLEEPAEKIVHALQNTQTVSRMLTKDTSQ